MRERERGRERERKKKKTCGQPKNVVMLGVVYIALWPWVPEMVDPSPAVP